MEKTESQTPCPNLLLMRCCGSYRGSALLFSVLAGLASTTNTGAAFLAGIRAEESLPLLHS